MKKSLFTDNWTCNGTPVTVPHDAMLHGQRDPEAACKGAGAYFPDGSWVYEKTFDRPEAEHVLLQFEGVYKNAKVFLNGSEAGGTAYGYLPFFVDADPFLTTGRKRPSGAAASITTAASWARRPGTKPNGAA